MLRHLLCARCQTRLRESQRCAREIPTLNYFLILKSQSALQSASKPPHFTGASHLHPPGDSFSVSLLRVDVQVSFVSLRIYSLILVNHSVH